VSRAGAYKAFVAGVIAAAGGRCLACGRSEADGCTLVVHHTVPVSALGVSSALVMDRRVAVCLCSYHHELSHGGRRSFPWSSIARGRGIGIGLAT
jgi:hypothetical protein